jgi:tetratricopeptide (TPR) repeat protein
MMIRGRAPDQSGRPIPAGMSARPLRSRYAPRWFGVPPARLRIRPTRGSATTAARAAANAVAAGAAALLEARGNLDAAADAYADVGVRWDTLGIVPELAFALLGQGRTLLALGRAAEARAALERAKGIFVGLKAAPALSEIDTAFLSLDTPAAPV